MVQTPCLAAEIIDRLKKNIMAVSPFTSRLQFYLSFRMLFVVFPDISRSPKKNPLWRQLIFRPSEKCVSTYAPDRIDFDHAKLNFFQTMLRIWVLSSRNLFKMSSYNSCQHNSSPIHSRTFKGVLANVDDITIDFWLPGMSTHKYIALPETCSNIARFVNLYWFEDLLRKNRFRLIGSSSLTKNINSIGLCACVDWERFLQFLVRFL